MRVSSMPSGAQIRETTILVALARAQFEDVAKQAEAEIGVFIVRARLEAELVVRKIVVQPLGRVIDVGIAQSFGAKLDGIRGRPDV